MILVGWLYASRWYELGAVGAEQVEALDLVSYGDHHSFSLGHAHTAESSGGLWGLH